MSVPTSAYRVRRPLTGGELDDLLDRVDAADAVGELLSVTVAGLFGPLLADLGETVSDYGPGRRLDPNAFAIPHTQWTAITTAISSRAQAWGLAAELAIELLNVMPASYDDPAVATPRRQQRDFRPEVHQMHIRRDAADTIAACEAHIAALGTYYGVDSTEHRQASASWHRQLAALFTTGHGARTELARDGTLSLVATTGGGLVFGIVFHGQRRRCTTRDCHTTIVEGGQWRPVYPDSPVLDHEHVPSYPLNAPQPGTWSAHS